MLRLHKLLIAFFVTCIIGACAQVAKADVIVNLDKATVCFDEQCHPVLVGAKTRPGNYRMEHVSTDQRGFGGDVIQFDEDAKWVYALHRSLTGNVNRERRLRTPTIADNKGVTLGCINMLAEHYDLLVQHLYRGGSTLVIVRQ